MSTNAIMGKFFRVFLEKKYIKSHQIMCNLANGEGSNLVSLMVFKWFLN